MESSILEITNLNPISTISLSFVLNIVGRPSSQMSFLEHFIQESSEHGRSRDPINVGGGGRSESSAERKTTGASTLSHGTGSIESDEPDLTDVDNQIASVASSRSNMSETSVNSYKFLNSIYMTYFSDHKSYIVYIYVCNILL